MGKHDVPPDDPGDDDEGAAGDEGHDEAGLTVPAGRTAVDAANDVMFPDLIPTAKFERIGDGVEGVILSATPVQQTDITTGERLFWSDGRPRMQVVILLDTGDIDPDIEEDDGRRRLFVKSDMMRAVRDAVKEAGKRKMSAGDTLAVRYAADGKAARTGLSKPKQYQAIYSPVEQPF